MSSLAAVRLARPSYETAEETRHQLRWHARSGVCDPHDDRLAVGLCAHPHGRRSVLEGGVEVVDEDLADPAGVCFRRRQPGRALHLHARGPLAQLGNALLDARRQVDGLQVWLCYASLDARDRQEVVDQAGEPPSLTADGRSVGPALLVRRRSPMVAEQIGETDDARQRRPQLVGRDGDEVGFELSSLREPLVRQLDLADQTAKLPLETLLLRHIADGGDDERAVPDAERRQADVDRELTPRARDSRELETGAHGPPAWMDGELRPVLAVLLPQILGQQDSTASPASSPGP